MNEQNELCPQCKWHKATGYDTGCILRVPCYYIPKEEPKQEQEADE